MKKTLSILSLIVIFACNSNFEAISIENQNLSTGLSYDSINKENSKNLINTYSGSANGIPLDTRFNFFSLSSNSLLAVNKLNNEHVIKFHTSKNGKWMPEKNNINQYPEFFFIKKAKLNNNYIKYSATNPQYIDIYEEQANSILRVNTNLISSSYRIEISPNGDKIYFVSSNLENLYQLKRISLNNWVINEVNTNALSNKITIIFIKHGGSHLLVKYLDKVTFKTKVDLISINNNTVAEVVFSSDDTEYQHILRTLNYKDIVATDANILFISNYYQNYVKFVSFNIDNNWLNQNSFNLYLNTSDIKEIHLDSYKDFITINYYDNLNKQANTKVFIYDLEANYWFNIKNKVINDINLEGTTFFTGRVNYNLHSNALETCALIKTTPKLLNYCVSDHAFVYELDNFDIENFKHTYLTGNPANVALGTNFNYYTLSNNTLISQVKSGNNFELVTYIKNGLDWQLNNILKTYNNFFQIKKAKNSENFIVYPVNNSTYIDYYYNINNAPLTIPVPEFSTIRINLSSDASSIFYSSFDLKKIYLLKINPDLSYENILLNSSLLEDNQGILYLKSDKNTLLISYRDMQFVKRLKLFRLDEFNNLINIEANILDTLVNINQDSITLTDNILNYININFNNIEVISYKITNSELTYLSNNSVHNSNSNILNYIKLDSFDNYFSLNFYNFTTKEVYNYFYKLVDSSSYINFKTIVLDNIILEGNNSIAGRVSYNIQNNVFDICIQLNITAQNINNYCISNHYFF